MQQFLLFTLQISLVATVIRAGVVPEFQQLNPMIQLTLDGQWLDSGESSSGGFKQMMAKEMDRRLMDGQAQKSVQTLRVALAAFKREEAVSEQRAQEIATAVATVPFFWSQSPGKVQAQLKMPTEMPGHQPRIVSAFQALTAKIAEEEEHMEMARFKEMNSSFGKKCFSGLMDDRKYLLTVHAIRLASSAFCCTLYRTLLRVTGVEVEDFAATMMEPSYMGYEAYWLGRVLNAVKQFYFGVKRSYLQTIEECASKKGSAEIGQNVRDMKALLLKWDSMAEWYFISDY